MSDDKKRRQYSLLVLIALPASILFWTWFSYNLALVWMDRTWWFVKGDIYSSKFSFLICNVIAGLLALMTYRSIPSDSSRDLQAFIARSGRIVATMITTVSLTSIVSLAITSLHFKAFSGDLLLAVVGIVIALACWRFEKAVSADEVPKD